LAISRLGDFNGDGVDDFAIGAGYYNGNQGHVSVILGKRGGLPSTIMLPEDFGTNAIAIYGTVGSYLGWTVFGIGHFYGSATNTALLADEPISNSNAGSIFAFIGPSGAPGSIDITSRSSYIQGAAGAHLGEEGMFALGNVGPGSQLALGVPTPKLGSTGTAQLFSGASATGPFSQAISITSAVSGNAKDFGQLTIGSAYSGRDSAGSFIGDSKPDVVVGSKVGASPRIYIIDGSAIVFPSSITAEAAAGVVVNLPASWTDFSNYSSPVADLNHDGYADIAVGQTDYTTTPSNGAVYVFY